MTDNVCPKCGAVHDPTKCKAHARSGKQCGAYPVEGQKVCKYHGGANPKAIAKAEERIVNGRVAAFLSSHGIDMGPAKHPIEGLMAEVQRSAAAVQFYGMLVAELDVPEPGKVVKLSETDMARQLETLVGIDEDGEILVRNSPGSIYGRNHMGDAAPHILLNLWNAERDRHAKLCKMALDAGVAERMVAMTEDIGRTIVEVINGVLADDALGLTLEQQAHARTKAARHLSLLPAPGQTA